MKNLFNLNTLFPRENKTLQQYNYIGDEIILSIFTILFCIAGLVGNGHVIWLLGFRMKRKPFAIYVLNLAVADFGTLLLLLPLDICLNPPSFDDSIDFPDVLVKLLTSLFILIYCTRQLLLAAISIDRWVSAVFPNWYRCHQSPVLFTTVCAFIWTLSFALPGVFLFLLAMSLIPLVYILVLLLGQIVTLLICPLIVFISTLTLLIKSCFNARRSHCRNPSKVILLTLLSFFLIIILACATLIMFPQIPLAYLGLWVSLKASINPLIYFLAGRQNLGKFQETMKVVFQRVFMEEREARMKLQPHTQTMLWCPCDGRSLQGTLFCPVSADS